VRNKERNGSFVHILDKIVKILFRRKKIFHYFYIYQRARSKDQALRYVIFNNLSEPDSFSSVPLLPQIEHFYNKNTLMIQGAFCATYTYYSVRIFTINVG
jgi:hypothetical protein